MAPSTNQPSSGELQPWQKVWTGEDSGQLPSITKKVQVGLQPALSKSLPRADQQKRVQPGIASLGAVSEFTVVYEGNTRTGPPPKEPFEGMDEWVKGALNAEKQENDVEVKQGSTLNIEIKK